MSTSARLVEPLEVRRLLAFSVDAAVDTNASKQIIDAIGAAVTEYQLPEHRQAAFYNRVFGDLGLTGVRSALDPAWEAVNDNADATVADPGGFNDKALAATMEFFKQAALRGVSTFLLSVWSPPAWMKTNKSVEHGGQLRPTDREEYAEFVTSALLRARDKWGVTVTHLSIGNEPWFTEPYASAMWTPDQYALTAKAVARRIKAAGLTTALVGPEEVSSIYRTQQYAKAVAADPEASAALPIFATHYLNEQDARTLSDTAAAAGKKLWFSEVGNGDADINGAIGIARGIDSALARADATAWFNWHVSYRKPFESLMTDGTPNPKYYALKHFARFVRPGDVRVAARYGGDAVRVSAYKNPATGRLTIVMSNNAPDDATVNVSIDGNAAATAFRQYRTSGTEKFARLPDLAGGPAVTVTLPSMSIVTLYNGPDAAPLTNTTAAPLVPVVTTADAWETSPLRTAAMLGRIDTVRQLLDNGTDVGQRFANGWDALFVASASPYAGADAVVRLLLERGANARATDDDGLTPLHVAAMNSVPAYGTPATASTDRVNALLAAGVDVNARDARGRTPLMYAAMLPKASPDLNPAKTDTAAIRALLAAGADPLPRDNAGRSARDYAVAEKAAAAVELLAVAPAPAGGVRAVVYRDANRNGVPDAGDTPLADVVVYLDLNANNQRDGNEPTLATAADGAAMFKDVGTGPRVVRAIAPDATYKPVEAGATVTVVPGAVVTATVVFTPPAPPPPVPPVPPVPPTPPPPVPPTPTGGAVRAYVVNDTNRDGLWSKGEIGLAGRTVWLDADNDGRLDAGEKTLVTGTNGVFTFTGLAAGTYNVRQVLPAGWKQTYPAANKPLTVKVAANQTHTGGRLTTVKG